MAPIPVPVRNVFCVGRNYADHVKEGLAKAGKEVKLPEVPQFFTKATGAVNGPYGDVRLDPAVTRLLDYEVELAVVIGTAGRDIAEGSRLRSCVWLLRAERHDGARFAAPPRSVV